MNLRMLIEYRLHEVEIPATARWNVDVRRYLFAFEAGEDREVIAFHHHPHVERAADPHVHLGAAADIGFEPLRKVHIPGRHMAISDVVRFAIEELGVQPLRTDWERVLSSD